MACETPPPFFFHAQYALRDNNFDNLLTYIRNMLMYFDNYIFFKCLI